MKQLLLACVLALTACHPGVRFADRPVLWHDPDDRPIPLPTRKGGDPMVRWAGARDAILLPAEHAFSFDYRGEARNVNALDEVPDSSWFEDRRRVDGTGRLRALEPALVAAGPAGEEPPPELPFTIEQAKEGGSAGGFVARDARGRKFVLKLDPRKHAGLVTSTEAVTSRLAWAAGWRVPAEWVLDIEATDLRIKSDAWRRDKWNERIPLDATALAQVLARAGRTDGRIRVLASRWIDGKILGQFAFFGRDLNDPNDRVAHQDRRDLRGFGVWTAWVNDIDTMQNNTLDTYVGEPGRGYVMHYQQDVGGAFGSFAGVPGEYWMGQETFFMPERILASLVTLGARRRPWEGQAAREHRARLDLDWPELGGFDDQGFDPSNWQPILDNPAFIRQTARDRYWGGKRIASFSHAEVVAAVSAGHYRPAAAERVTQVLWNRREKIARAFFRDVAPLDWFRFENDQLCFDDLWIAAGLGGEAGTRWRAREQHKDLPLVGGAGAARCVLVPAGSGYREIAVAVRRPAERHFGPEVVVHVMVDPRGRRILGVVR